MHSAVHYPVCAPVHNPDSVLYLLFLFFPTDCPLSELQMAGPPRDDIYPQCQQDQDTVTSITIPNGFVNVTCYSPATVGDSLCLWPPMCVMKATSLMQPPVYECAGTMDCGLELP